MVGLRAILLSAALAPVPSHGPPAWQWPLRPPPRVVRGFSPPAHPWQAGHRGVDLAARPGRPVYAAGPGRVGFAGDLAGRGVVTIVHGALRTTYLPVRPVVRAGQTVRAGQRIGVVPAALGHCPDQTCLHWGLLRGGVYLDPLGLLGLGPVRLLPWWSAAPGGAWPATDPPDAGRSGPVPPAPDTGPPAPQTPGRDRAWGGTGARRPSSPPRRNEDPGPRAEAGGPATPSARPGMRRSVAARLAGFATPAGAGPAGVMAVLAVLGALTAFLPPWRAAALRRRFFRRPSLRRPSLRRPSLRR